MIKHSKLSGRYAHALLMALEQQAPNDIDRAQMGLSRFVEACNVNDKFRGFMVNPLIAMATRGTVLKQSLELLKLPEQVIRLITIVFDRNKFKILAGIATSFSLLVDHRRRVVDVKITSALTLSDQDKEGIAVNIRKVVLGTPRYNYCSAPELLGGLIVQFDGKMLDGSLRTRLAQMQKELSVR